MPSVEKNAINIPLRVTVAMGVVAVVFLILILRLWYLQIVQGDHFRLRSENNRIRTVFVSPPRGLLLDRNEKVLVKNRPAFSIDFVSEDSPTPEKTIRNLAEILHESPDTLIERLRSQKKRRRFEPKLILKDVSRDTVAAVAARRHQLPGVIVNVTPAREYFHGSFASHVIGYLREITKEQLESGQYPGYRLGDFVGQFGVEKEWERFLQGRRGVQAVVVNAQGTRIGESSFEPEAPGNNVILTLDFETQRIADEQLAGKRGAIVAMDPQTGEIIALSSGPSFDPNIFTGELAPELWQELIAGKERRLSNRAVQGAYPPGSVFKIFMSVAALAESVIGVNDRIFCPGFLAFAGRNYRCHKRSGHGYVDLKDAMIQSCDVYYYTVGQRLWVDRIHGYATRFGFGTPTGLELVKEVPGLIPSSAWKRAAFSKEEDKKWYPGETLSVAIGQGATTTTPLQIARGISALVNGGRVLRPYLVKEIRSADGNLRDTDFQPHEISKVEVSERIMKIVRDSMVGVVNDVHGTGRRAQLPKESGIIVAGKTGTAQVASLKHHGTRQEFEDHAWFAGYAPANKPEIVVVAIIENSGHGGAVAAPAVREVMAAFFKDRIPPPVTESPRAR